MSRIIVVTSGKGGVGKTTLCANLGTQLAKSGLRVLLIDVDLGLNNLDVVMGVENKVVYDVCDVVMGKCRAKQALIQDFFIQTLYVLPSNHTYTNFNINSAELRKIINDMEYMFDYIIIDCPAGIDPGFHRAVACATEAIVVTTPHISSVRDADKVVGLLKSYNICNVGLIINRARGDLMVSGEMLDVETITDFLQVDLLGVVPDDDVVSTKLLTGGGVNLDTDAYKSFYMISNKIHNGVNDVFDCTKKYKGVLGNIRRNIKRLV